MSRNLVYMFKNTTELENSSKLLGMSTRLIKNLSKILDEIPIINFPVIYFEDYDRCILLGDEEHSKLYKYNPWIFIKGKPRGRIIELSCGVDYIHLKISESPFDFNYNQDWHELGGYRIIRYDMDTNKFKLYCPKEKPVSIVECIKTDLAKWQYSVKLNS